MNDIKYFLLYDFDTRELYAYSSNKKEIKTFLKFRNKNKFLKRELILNADQRKHLSCHHSNRRLRNYKFDVSGVPVSIPLTYKEILDIESIRVQQEVYLVTLSTIDPNIFNKKIFGSLFDIGYNNFWMKWRYGDDIEDTSFMLFMSMFGDYINLNEIRKKALKNIIGGKDDKV